MNFRQLLVLMLATTFVVTVAAFPPMRVVARYTDGTLFARDVRGGEVDYDIRLAPRNARLAAVRADHRTTQLMIESAGILAFAGAGVYALRTRAARPARATRAAHYPSAVTAPPHDPATLPDGLPAPADDGAAAHLRARRIPDVTLTATDAARRPLSEACSAPTVLFFYPRTGVPGQPPNLGFSGEEWESIPGARGCTPQSCGFRDLHQQFTALGVRVLGVSTNSPAHQQEFCARTRMPFHFLSDADLALQRALNLPTFEFPVESGGPSTLLKRMAWYVEPDAGGQGVSRIRNVWYPVFPPDQNAGAVLKWLTVRRELTIRPLSEADRPFVLDRCGEHFGGAIIWSVDQRYDVRELPGFIALKEGRPAGMLTFHPHADALEVISLAALPGHCGVGTALMDAAEDEARARALPTLMLTTTNDNLDAQRFYQRRGMHIHAVHAGFIDRYRQRNPAIPRVGHYGIPIRDDLELRLSVAP